MKKSIVFLVVLLVSVAAFAGNKKPDTTKQKPPVRIEKRRPDNSKPILRPMPTKKLKPIAK